MVCSGGLRVRRFSSIVCLVSFGTQLICPSVALAFGPEDRDIRFRLERAERPVTREGLRPSSVLSVSGLDMGYSSISIPHRLSEDGSSSDSGIDSPVSQSFPSSPSLSPRSSQSEDSLKVHEDQRFVLSESSTWLRGLGLECGFNVEVQEREGKATLTLGGKTSHVLRVEGPLAVQGVDLVGPALHTVGADVSFRGCSVLQRLGITGGVGSFLPESELTVNALALERSQLTSFGMLQLLEGEVSLDQGSELINEGVLGTSAPQTWSGSGTVLNAALGRIQGEAPVTAYGVSLVNHGRAEFSSVQGVFSRLQNEASWAMTLGSQGLSVQDLGNKGALLVSGALGLRGNALNSGTLAPLGEGSLDLKLEDPSATLTNNGILKAASLSGSGSLINQKPGCAETASFQGETIRVSNEGQWTCTSAVLAAALRFHNSGIFEVDTATQVGDVRSQGPQNTGTFRALKKLQGNAFQNDGTLEVLGTADLKQLSQGKDGVSTFEKGLPSALETANQGLIVVPELVVQNQAPNWLSKNSVPRGGAPGRLKIDRVKVLGGGPLTLNSTDAVIGELTSARDLTLQGLWDIETFTSQRRSLITEGQVTLRGIQGLAPLTNKGTLLGTGTWNVSTLINQKVFQTFGSHDLKGDTFSQQGTFGSASQGKPEEVFFFCGRLFEYGKASTASQGLTLKMDLQGRARIQRTEPIDASCAALSAKKGLSLEAPEILVGQRVSSGDKTLPLGPNGAYVAAANGTLSLSATKALRTVGGALYTKHPLQIETPVWDARCAKVMAGPGDIEVSQFLVKRADPLCEQMLVTRIEREGRMGYATTSMESVYREQSGSSVF